MAIPTLQPPVQGCKARSQPRRATSHARGAAGRPALPPCLLQLVEGVRGVIPGRAEAEDLVVLLQSCLPAFCTAVRHLERGDSSGTACGSRKRGSQTQLCSLPDQQCPGSLERQTAQEPGWMERTQ